VYVKLRLVKVVFKASLSFAPCNVNLCECVPWMSSFYRVLTSSSSSSLFFLWVGALHIYVALDASILSAHAKASAMATEKLRAERKNLIDWPAKSQGPLWLTMPPNVGKGESEGVKRGEDVECKNLRDKYKMAEANETDQMKL